MTPSSSAVAASMPTAFAEERRRRVRDQALAPRTPAAPGRAPPGRPRDVLGRGVEERGQRGRGVLGIAADLAVLERLQRDELVAEVEVGGDVVARGLEGLGVDLAEDDLLGEVLRADRERDPVVVGVLLDRGRAGLGRRRRRTPSSSSPQAATASASTSAASNANSPLYRALVLILGCSSLLGDLRGIAVSRSYAVARAASRSSSSPRGREQALDAGEHELEREREQGDQDRPGEHARRRRRRRG